MSRFWTMTKSMHIVFDPLEFIAEVVAHIPDAYEKTAIEYGGDPGRSRAKALRPAAPRAV